MYITLFGNVRTAWVHFRINWYDKIVGGEQRSDLGAHFGWTVRVKAVIFAHIKFAKNEI